MNNNSKIGLVFFYGAGLTNRIWKDLSKIINIPYLYIDYPGREENPKSNKGLSLDDYADFITNQINSWKVDKVVFVAHSIGGVLALKVLNRIRPEMAGFIAISASIPVNGNSFLSSHSFFARIFMKIIFRLAGTRPPDAAIKQSLCNDLSVEQADEIVNRFTPESRLIYTQKIKYNMPDIPKLYIKLTRDAAFGKQIQDKMIENLKPHSVLELNTGHLPMLSKPDELAPIINDFVFRINV